MSPEHEALIADHRGIAVRIARRYSNGRTIDPDLEQAAMVGLVLAASRYRPEAGPFAPYAVATVSGEVKRYLRNTGWAVHVTRSVQEQSIAVERVVGELTQVLGRSPTPSEVGEHLGLSVEEVVSAIRARDVRFSQELPSVDPSAPGSDLDLTDQLVLKEALAGLGSEDAELLWMRFGEQRTQRELADQFNVSQPHIHRRLQRIFDQLRSRFLEMGYDQ